VKKPRKPARKAKAGRKVWTGEPWGPSWGDQTQDEWEKERRRGKVVFVGESENTRLLRMLVKQQKAQSAPAKPANPKGRPKAKIKAKAKGRPSIKLDLALKIMTDDLKPPPGLLPAEIEKKVLAKMPPDLRRRWQKRGPDGLLIKDAISRTVIYRAYQKYLEDLVQK
jgi:hypothetical protein